MRPLLAAVLTLAAVTAFADMEVSAPRLVRRGSAQIGVSIASSPDGFLTVWRDDLNFDARAARIGPDGTMLDPVSFHIAGAAGSPADAVTASWTGSHYLVVHETQSRLYTTPVARDGSVGTTRELPVGFNNLPQLASSNAGTLLVTRQMSSIGLIALDPDGAVIEQHAMFADLYDGPLVAPLGNAFLVTWKQMSPQRLMSVYASVVDARGKPVGQPQMIAEDAYRPTLVSTGDRALITYTRFAPDIVLNPYGLAPVLLGRIVTADGVSTEVTIAATEDAAISDSATATTDGRFTVTWMQKTGETQRTALTTGPPPFVPTFALYGALVSPDGVVLDRSLLVANDIAEPVLAGGGGRILLTWRDRRSQIDAAMLDGIGAVMRPVEIARSAPIQDVPQLATGGDITLVVWTEDPAGDGQTAVFARRIGPGGVFLDEAPVKMSGEGQVTGFPKVAASEGEFAVTWMDTHSQISMRRIRADGTLVGDAPISIGRTNNSGMMAIASDGSGYAALIVEREILTVALFGHGDEIRYVDLAPYSSAGWSRVSMAWDGLRYVAAVPISTLVGSAMRFQIYVLSFENDGALLSGPAALAGAKYDEVNPAVACRIDSCLVVWSYSPEVRAAIVEHGSDVRLLGPITTTRSATPAVLATDDGYDITWMTWDSTTANIVMRSISSDGELRSLPLRIASQTTGSVAFDLTHTTRNGTLLAYTATIEGLPYGGARRVFVRAAEPARRRAARH